MKRYVNVYLLNDEGTHEFVYQWETKKKGLVRDVVHYLIQKFNHSSRFPAQYAGRPLRRGDRIELVVADGESAGNSAMFELASAHSFIYL